MQLLFLVSTAQSNAGMGLYGAIWGYLGLYGAIWGYMGLYGAIWGYTLPYLGGKPHDMTIVSKMSLVPIN